ncbi:M20 family metallo-hydrolase [Desulfovibrio sp. OttesenSCG-928-C06]|nr:M20 family metallo-hydrolase [Desulfovibrio sp. OttesenSCG-928-C06]
MQEQLFSYLDQQHDFVARLQKGMTAIPAIGPENNGDGEAQKALYLRKAMQAIGVGEIREINAPDNRVSAGFRPNLAARIEGKSPRTLWIIGHMDVVPAGDASLWESPPFDMQQSGDLLYGRGVEDNQQAIASALLVIKTLTENKITPDLSLGVLLVSDEETHSHYGLKYVMEAAPDLISPEDLVVIPDIGDQFGMHIEVAEKSCLWLRIAVTGKQCHASTPDEGINTLLASSAAVLALEELASFFPQKDALYSPPRSTFVPSKKEANVDNINTVPGLDVFYLDCRVLPGVELEAVAAKAEELVTKAVKPYKAGVKIQAIHSEKAPEPTSLEAPVVRRLMRSLKKLRQLDARPVGAGGQTVAAVLRARGIPAAAWSTILGNAHAPNEKSSIINTIADAKVLTDMLFD